ncbi:hypothetical protein AJ79_03180 [Helicocarpus griseus UAMH5409]|uniref:FCP1 homology domain-containing protein n=1 Tax=Helicocarpus griseus UAMH5409 TaxID=1447875 RepID=A0A2B7Y0F7_9EURO|nr:hypothetical protein AJ79_03180 [Helicocarpus griseus UAMH5409]
MTTSSNGPGSNSALPLPNDAPPKNPSSTDQSVDEAPVERRPSHANSVQGSPANAERPKKKRSFLRVPSRSSSNTKLRGQATGPERPEDAAESDHANKQRASSKASSKRSRRANAPDTANATPKPATPDIDDKSKEKVSKGPSKLFSFLSCCSSSKDDQEDSSLPPKKTVKPQSSHGRQPTPVEKAEPSAADSSTADSREPVSFDEKAALKAGAHRRESQNEDEVTAAPSGASSDSFAKRHIDEQPTLPAPFNSGSGSGSGSIPCSGREFEPHGLPTVAALEQSSSSNTTNASDGKNAGPTEPVSERQNGDNDVVMQDTPSADSYIDEDVDTGPHDEPAQRMELPPPPPLDRKTDIASKQVPPVPVVQSEKQQWLLPPIQPHLQSRKCLVLDLDETLVHSSFKVLEKADFTIPVEIEGQYHNIYVIKRPGVDQFMKRVGELYEVVVFTASVSKYGDPLLDQLDIHKVVHHRLFRDSCYNHQGNYVKDLSQVGRDLRETIIIDNSPTSYIFHPQHAIPISSWFSDAHDNELLDLIPVLEDLAGTQVRDVSLVLNVAL